jgi:uncharacterized membrane protein YccC
MAALSAAVGLAVLPHVETFVGFSATIGLYLVPVGTLMALTSLTTMFLPMAVFFLLLLAPANLMSYDLLQFDNNALAIIAGCGAGALAFRLIPPLSPALRTERLLALTLRDLRRLATGPIRRLPGDWPGRMYTRLAAVPDAAQPLQRAQLVAGLTVGTEIIRLRRAASRLGPGSELDSALAAFARGDSAAAVAWLTALDRRLASVTADRQTSMMMRDRSRMLAVCDALERYRAYFDAGARS